jgi:hypothetical protein
MGVRERAKFITILGNKMLHKKIIMTREREREEEFNSKEEIYASELRMN